MTTIVRSHRSVIINVKDKYPNLYAHMFNEQGVTSIVGWEYDEFLERIGVNIDSNPIEIWNYVVENEDKHDWWML